MITRLELKNFKSFKHAELELGNFTLLIGANASGKSNIRDAFRILQGIGRGYSLADIAGVKWGEGSSKEWAGIRGGPREIAYSNSRSFAMKVGLKVFGSAPVSYSIEVNTNPFGTMNLKDESLSNARKARSEGEDGLAYSIAKTSNVKDREPGIVSAGFSHPLSKRGKKTLGMRDDIPILSQAWRQGHFPMSFRDISILLLFESFNFLDFDPESLKRRSYPGQRRAPRHPTPG